MTCVDSIRLGGGMAPVHLVCHVATWSVYVWLVWILSGSVMSGWWHGPCSLGVSCCYMECVCVTCVDSLWLSDVWVVAWPLFTRCVMLLHGVCMCDLCGFHPAQ